MQTSQRETQRIETATRRLAGPPPLKPSRYFENDADEDFRRAEFTYAGAHFARKKGKKIYEQVEALAKLDEPLKVMQAKVRRGERPDSRLVIKCFERLMDSRTMPTCSLVADVAPEIFNRIAAWRSNVDYCGDEDSRKNLEAIERSIKPDTRGKKPRGKADTIPVVYGMRKRTDWDVLSFYFRTVFRLFQARHALKQNPGTVREKIRKAARDFPLYPADHFQSFQRLTEKAIREGLCGLDVDYQRHRLPLNLKEVARIVTADRFNLNPKTVSNLINS